MVSWPPNSIVSPHFLKTSHSPGGALIKHTPAQPRAHPPNYFPYWAFILFVTELALIAPGAGTQQSEQTLCLRAQN